MPKSEKKCFTLIWDISPDVGLGIEHLEAEDPQQARDVLRSKIRAGGAEAIGGAHAEILIFEGRHENLPEDPTLIPRDQLIPASQGSAICVRHLARVPGEQMLVGDLEILGERHIVYFVRVHDRQMIEGAPDLIQKPYQPEKLGDDQARQSDAFGIWEIICKNWEQADLDGPLRTVRVPGFDGEYVLLIIPTPR